MVQTFGINTVLVALNTAAVVAGLELLAVPPEWLLALEDTDRVLGDLEANRSRLGLGTAALVACKFKRAHLDDGTWSTLHRFKVEDHEGAGVREVDLRGRLLPPGVDAPPVSGPNGSEPWHGYLPDLRLEVEPQPADVVLFALTELTDATLSRSIVETALRSRGGSFAQLELTGVHPHVMRYRAGLRCTIRYELEYPPGPRPDDWPEAVIAKVYEGDQATHTHKAMADLWSSPLGQSATVTIAEPLAVVPEHHLLLQRLVPGDHTLKNAIADVFAEGADAGAAALTDVVRRVGRGLAELHSSGVTYGPAVTWASQLAAAQVAADQLIAAVPHLSGAVAPLLTGLDRAAVVDAGEPLVPSHRSFRPAQILLGAPTPAILDFDGFCQSEAGLDLALFRTTLCDLALRGMSAGDHPADTEMTTDLTESRLQPLDELCAVFLAGYEEVRPVNHARLALWDTLVNTKDVLDCWRKVKFEHLDRRVDFLRRRLGLDRDTPARMTPS